MLGTLLTWMAENTAPVFIAATANQIEGLPPEIIRKGRLDEIFFVDLPDENDREHIFSLHLKRRNVALDASELTALAQKSEGFSGAEIEQAVIAALYLARSKRGALSHAHVLTELKSTRPLSVVMAEQITALRAWAKDRTVMAN